ncbi:hypothetical protein [Sphingomonas oryzagri]
MAPLLPYVIIRCRAWTAAHPAADRACGDVRPPDKTAASVVVTTTSLARPGRGFLTRPSSDGPIASASEIVRCNIILDSAPRLRKAGVMESEHILVAAITRQLRISAVYNKGRVILAPHILYKRHDELYVDAVTVERDGAAPRETKLGTFKLQGLNDPRLDNHLFEPFVAFRPSDPKYIGTTLAAVGDRTGAALSGSREA